MSEKLDLNEIRKEITSLDNELLTLFAKRRALTLNVAKSKVQQIRPIRDQQREQELLIRLIKQGKELGLDAHYVTSVFQTIIEDSVLNQQAYLQNLTNPNIQTPTVSVAFLGDKGSYSYLASHRYFSRRAEKIIESGCQNFSDILQQVESGQVDYGMLPIENTSSGSINQVYDLLQHTNLFIVGEITQPIEHCLLTAVNTSLDKIKTIYAHGQPFAQCSNFLDKQNNIRIEYCDSTADAMVKVSELQDETIAVIGSEEGGQLYKLQALEKSIANQNENHSRFILVARKAVDVAEQIPAKTAIILATGQKAGALVECLLVLKEKGINMCKLESRPIQGRPWEEMFYIDVEANLKSFALQEAISEITAHTNFIKVLGCYPIEHISPTSVPSNKI
ncbi:prephenate dehydratase [Colwellia sp. 4_MG-2023]|uniref:prephenate dehydratase n=1 Tax=unclassified Colwellia TaxID=196834 RepID=UPI001C0A219E|nr:MULTISPECIES: prephenate dehydratase [unclassified Colwellia]MBU2924849.1 prephenate dehydratase [Colwellia sp. C2M11]MDO6487143.1 prephenate dehydratase [Colwellia sp. 6_MG-2023]MDO6505492.1 prephenate dehydratase [Colwellia sp. 5_MG-2023]MDO6554212.1 prephenate dehydratase [Colwellia sp. 4_MG-2023]MDO6650913.1 prephenate dehydratase [Colwellia sp. 3_MG-2023]